MDQNVCGNELPDESALVDGAGRLANVVVTLAGVRARTSATSGGGVMNEKCQFAPRVPGYIMVTDDMAAVTSGDGTFTLSDVPAGTYELRIWHESLTAPPQKVVVTAGQTTGIAVTMQ